LVYGQSWNEKRRLNFEIFYTKAAEFMEFSRFSFEIDPVHKPNDLLRLSVFKVIGFP